MKLRIRALWQRVSRPFRAEPLLWRARAMFLLGVFVSYCAVELLNENNPLLITGDLAPWQIMWNLFWYGLIFLLCWLACGTRHRPAAFTGSLISFVIGLANHYVLRFRGKTLFPVDLLGIRTAVNVAGGYDYTPDAWMWGAMVLLVLYWAALLRLSPREKRTPRAPRKWRLGTAGLCLGFLLMFFCTPLLEVCDIHAAQWNTQNNGFLFNFMVSLSYSFLDEPEGYDRQAVEVIMDDTLEELAAEPEPTESIQPVNIIAIMDESFADFSLFARFSANQDPLEFFHSMTENTVRGWLYSPVIGGGTANCEYEFLTGNSTVFLPEGTVAYQLYVDDPTPSLASVLGDLGYDTWAFHQYDGSGWNRRQAYANLGFAHQLYQEDVEDPAYVRSYISDLCGYEKIMAITDAARETGERTFVFNVTMQNHSGYAQDWHNLNHTISLTGALDGVSANAEQYFSLLDRSDEALRALITHYRAVEEPTLIIFFGDHQPPLSDTFYETLYGKDMEERTDEEILAEYTVPFFIWANYDIPEARDVTMSMNYLSVYAAELASMPLTGYQELIAETMDAMPVIHEIGCCTGQSDELLEQEELPAENRDLLEEYEYIAYYGLIDDEGDIDAFFDPIPPADQ